MGKHKVMNREVEKYAKLAYCGIYCGGCSNYRENADCSGCRNETELLADCPTRSCAIEREVLFCGECSEFPCLMLKEFYGDGIPHHIASFTNSGRIREVGPDLWLEEQGKEHTCGCGKRKLWFTSTCGDKTCTDGDCRL